MHCCAVPTLPPKNTRKEQNKEVIFIHVETQKRQTRAREAPRKKRDLPWGDSHPQATLLGSMARRNSLSMVLQPQGKKDRDSEEERQKEWRLRRE